MDILDFCFYQRNVGRPCPFSNSTCAHCPWSNAYRIAWRSRDMLLSVCNKVADFPCYYRHVETGF